jgi:hypothetical protein
MTDRKVVLGPMRCKRCGVKVFWDGLFMRDWHGPNGWQHRCRSY